MQMLARQNWRASNRKRQQKAGILRVTTELFGRQTQTAEELFSIYSQNVAFVISKACCNICWALLCLPFELFSKCIAKASN